MEIQQTIDLPQKLDTLREVMQSMAGGVEEQYAESTLIVLPVDYLKMEHTVIHAQLDSVASRVNAIAENSAGHIDVLSHIAIPLIIALFAFAFTYLFSVITRINEKYNSEAISEMFKTSKAYRCYMWGAPISVGYIIFFGILSLVFTESGHPGLMCVMRWIGIVVAGCYAAIILWFVQDCLRYDDYLKILPLIEGRYPKKNASFQDVKDRTNRLIGLCCYAIRERKGNLLTTVLWRVNELGKEEQARKGENYSYQTLLFYDSILDSYIQFPCDSDTENSLIWNWFQTFRQDRLPMSVVVCRMLKIMVEAVKSGRIGIYDAYMEKCRMGYDFISKLQTIGYACGKDVVEQVKIEKERIEFWKEQREIHYLAAAYLFSIGHFEILRALTKNAGYNRLSFFPVTSPDIIKVYANCKEKQDDQTGVFYGYRSLDTVIGHRYGKDILEKFTAMMLLLSVPPDNPEEKQIISGKKRDIIFKAKDEIVRFGELWQKHSEIFSQYPQIRNEKIDVIFESGMEQLTTDGEVRRKPEGIKHNIFDLKITKKDEVPIREMYNSILYHNRSNISEGLEGDLTEDKKEQAAMGPYSLLANKEAVLEPDVWRDSSTFHDMHEVFKSRFLYMVYFALSQMRIKDVSTKWGDFEKMFTNYVGNDGDKYVIIDNDCSLRVFAEMDKLSDGQKWPLHRYYKGAYCYDAEIGLSRYLKDVPLIESFDRTILVVRFADMPVLVPTSDQGVPYVSFEDESNKEKGWAAVRITVEPNLNMKYSKEAEVLRVKIKR